ncbi:MAG: hypothetical protein OEY49_14365 [Candidatus Heimdallarchaeota archaeon]|nr:hypothetical protein [Candidatus Heimdallarchaeota archaeon]
MVTRDDESPKIYTFKLYKIKKGLHTDAILYIFYAEGTPKITKEFFIEHWIFTQEITAPLNDIAIREAQINFPYHNKDEVRFYSLSFADIIILPNGRACFIDSQHLSELKLDFDVKELDEF